MNIYIFAQERESRKKRRNKDISNTTGSPSLPEGKKCGHAGSGTENCNFQSEIQLPAFWPGLFLNSVNRHLLGPCVLFIVSFLTTPASLFSERTWKTFLLNQKKQNPKNNKNLFAALVCGYSKTSPAAKPN